MAAAADIDRHDAIEHAARALDRVDAGPRRARMRGLAAHGDDHVDAALVGERDPAGGADDDDRELGAVAERLADADRGVMSSGLAGGADGEDQAPCSVERSAAVFTAASAAASEPFCSETPRPRTKLPPAPSISSPA